jgi:hypothetical protein
LKKFENRKELKRYINGFKLFQTFSNFPKFVQTFSNFSICPSFRSKIKLSDEMSTGDQTCSCYTQFGQTAPNTAYELVLGALM